MTVVGSSLARVGHSMSRHLRGVIVGIGLVCLFAPGLASGQARSDAFSRLFIDPDPRFSVLSESQVDILRRLIAVGISTIPAESGSASVTEVSLDNPPPARSFGPQYLLQSVPLTPGKFAVFAGYRRTLWTALDGIQLDSGRLRNRTPAFANRAAIDSSASLELATDTLTVVVNQGLPRAFTLGAYFPFHRVCLSGTRETVGIAPVRVDHCGTGIGDIGFRAKKSWPAAPLWFAFQADVVLPTGDVEDLRGRGQSQTNLLFAAARPVGRLQPHLNGGAILGGHGVKFTSVNLFGTESLLISSVSPSRGVQYGVGADYVHSSRLTMNIEVLGRVLRNRASFEAVDILNGASLEAHAEAWQPFVLLSGGAKFRIKGDAILHAHIARQMSSSGLKAPIIFGAAVELGTR